MPLVALASPYIHAVPEPDAAIPRVRINLSWGAANAVVYRIDQNGARIPVRESEPNVVWSSGLATIYDYESPFQTPMRYQVTDGTTTFTSNFVALNVSNKAWLRHPLVPILSMPVIVEDNDDYVLAANRSVVFVLGRTTPVVTTDGRRKSRAGSMTFATYELDEVEKLEAVFYDQTPLLLDVPPSWGWGIPHQYMSFGDLTVSRTRPRLHIFTERSFTVPYNVVDRPLAGIVGKRTWLNVPEEAATWKDVPKLYMRWIDVATGNRSGASVVDPGAGTPAPPPTPPPSVTSAGPDASIAAGTTFVRTATEGSGTATSRSWRIIGGPLGKDTTIGTAAALSWKPGQSPAGTTDIRQPVITEMCYQITSTAENSTTEWWTAYRYIEDIDDDRGYTGGLVGFTSGTSDMLALVRQYAIEKPTGNLLAPYIPGLEACDAVGMGPGASAAAASNLGTAFQNAWRSSADNDPIFRKVQRDFRKSMYFDDALVQALADGVGPLGLVLHYDILVNHGVGNDSESYGGIIAAARASSSKPPSQGGNESAYLTKLCDLRDAVLIGWGDFQSNGRSTIFRKLITDNKLTLQAPFTWSVYGDTFTMTTRPAVSNDSVLGTFTLRYTATGIGTDDVNVTVT